MMQGRITQIANMTGLVEQLTQFKKKPLGTLAKGLFL